MRTIKLRAWDKLGKRMLMNVGMKEDGTAWSSAIYALSWKTDTPYPTMDVEFESHNFVISQSTGKKDVNGVDIYEGDICEDKNKTLWKIVYSNDEAMYLGRAGWGESHTLVRLGDLRVVSNIYEDPDYLTREALRQDYRTRSR